MFAELLNLFPAHTHPLILVSDPDGLLGGEASRVELARRGFTLIQENEPVLLRRRVEAALPATVEHPLLIITSSPLQSLPYDLWQPAHRIQLSLHMYFPHLAYPVLQTLNSEQLEMLAQVQPPAAPLGRQKTIDFLLREIFGADLAQLNPPHRLIGWLSGYHQSGVRMPELLRDGLVERLRRIPAFQAWNLAEWMEDRAAFSAFMQDQWTGYVQAKGVREGAGEYRLLFKEDPRLQEMLPDLVRQRIIQPVEISAAVTLPGWARIGLAQRDPRAEQIEALLEELNRPIAELVDAGWETWKRIAYRWAELNVLLFDARHPVLIAWEDAFRSLCRALDAAFLDWLRPHYTLLGAQRLPRPAHVHHIPHYLAYQRELGAAQAAPAKVALLVLDGMSLADWTIIQPEWARRNPRWQIHTDLLLAQIPTLTALSRYALISGQRPSDFAGSLASPPSEKKKWQLFWSNAGLALNTIELVHLALDRCEAPPEIESSRLLALGLIDDTLDRLTHNATLGAADRQASLRLWLDAGHTPNAAPLEALIARLLEREFSVFLASDHGNVEAVGFGQPSEGLIAQTRGKRVRIYPDRGAAQRVQMAFAETILWEKDGLNPPDLFALLPTQRKAFASSGEVLVTHGGVTLDEVIVPWVRIDKKN